MNVENLKKTYPLLIDYLKENGYTKAYIGKFITDIHMIINKSECTSINSYEDYYTSLTDKYTKSTLHHKLKIIGKIKQFDLKGVYPNQTHRCGFLKPNNYNDILPEYQEFVNLYEKLASARGVSESYIKHHMCAASKFLKFQQIHGASAFTEITENLIQKYFYDGDKIIRGYDVMKQIRHVFNECRIHYQLKECDRIISLLPKMKKGRKVYPFLEEEEISKIKATLCDNSATDICLRDRAIITIAHYTGLRGCDISSLTLDDIDWNKNFIKLIQNKTGVPITLPLRPIVGNLIYDYVNQERPKSKSRIIFLTIDRTPRKLSCSAMNHIAINFFKTAGVRGPGTKMGLHLFRHNFAMTLLQNGIQTPVITEILGHASPTSIEPYLESNLLSLKNLALSIEQYPVELEGYKL